jgi:hypothetical protein
MQQQQTVEQDIVTLVHAELGRPGLVALATAGRKQHLLHIPGCVSMRPTVPPSLVQVQQLAVYLSGSTQNVQELTGRQA